MGKPTCIPEQALSVVVFILPFLQLFIIINKRQCFVRVQRASVKIIGSL